MVPKNYQKQFNRLTKEMMSIAILLTFQAQ